MRLRLTRGVKVFLAACVLAQATALAQESGEWERIAKVGEGDFVSHIINALATDEKGDVWVGTDRGLAWTSDSGRTWNPVNLAFAVPREPGRPSYEESPAAGFDLPAEASRRRNNITCLKSGRAGLWVGTSNGLCFKGEDHREWSTFVPGPEAPGPEIWAVEEFMGEVWVAGGNGLFRSKNSGVRWDRIRGNFPWPIRAIKVGEWNEKRVCWLAGFDSEARYGGGSDVLRSSDGGVTWDSLATATASPISRIVSTRVHKLFLHEGALWAATRHGLAVSRDGGEEWRRIRTQSGLDAGEVFDLAYEGGRMWAATSEGVYSSADGGRQWVHTGHLRCPIAVLTSGRDLLWLGSESGLIRRIRGGDLRSYSVQANVLAMARTVDFGGETWWAGTTGGLLSSRNRGENWVAQTVADGLPGNKVLSLASVGDRIWVGTDGGIWTTSEGGSTRQYGREHGLRGLRVKDIVAEGGRVWAATDRGLALLPAGKQEWRVFQPSREWHALCVVGDTIFGAVSEAADPTGGVSVIRGSIEPEQWRTMEVPGLRGADVHQFLAAGGDVWMAADTGLFRTRDEGTSWARFGSESLWSSRITALCLADANVLCVQAVPNDPPAPTAFLNVTRDGGRSWYVLSGAIPGHAGAIMSGKGDLVAGMLQIPLGNNLLRGGVSVCRDFQKALQPGRSGWLMWRRIAAFAAATYRTDRLGSVSVMDRYALHSPTVWLGSLGAGAIERGIAPLDELVPAWDLTGALPRGVGAASILPERQILTAVDSPDGLWFGTADGLYFYDRFGDITTYRPGANGLLAAPVRSLAVTDGHVWVGTDYGLSLFDRRAALWDSFEVGDSPLTDNRIWALGFDGESLWGGTANGAFRIGPDGNWMNFLEQERITDMVLGSEREYFATNRGVIVRGRQGEPRRHLQTHNSPLPDNEVNRLFIDGQDLWVATGRGVSRIPNDKAEPSPQPVVEPSRRGPEGVLILINQAHPASVRIGEAYAALRDIPAANICRIECPDDETITRSVFDETIRRPLLRHILTNGLGRTLFCIVTTYGVPLRVVADVPPVGEDADRSISASLDSELTLLGLRYPAQGPIPNPYLHRDERFDSTRFGFYLVTRLDGPDSRTVIARLNDAKVVEEEQSFGSRGFARFDLHPDESPLAERLDPAIMACYRTMRRQERFMGRVEPPENTTLPFFRKDSAINTFFFVGWREEEYKPEVFSWVQGAIAVPLDPVTAATLRDADRSWLAGAVASGLAAGIGNVDDPGPAGMPSVAGLYQYVKAGYTWAEAAYMCVPYLSWQTVVLGDPLYSPYR